MKGSIKLRYIIQALFVIIVGVITFNHSLAETGAGISWLSNASIHAICPFGGVVSVYQYFVSGTFVKKIHESSFILMWLAFILAIGFGPVICGWVCPLGSVQEWFSGLGRKMFGSRFNKFILYRYDRFLRYIRYLVLIWVVYITAITGKLAFADIDPYAALFHLWSDELALSGLLVLGITLTGSLLVERPWCKYACPYGALLGISNLFRVFKIRRNSNTCINCTKCTEVCPMNIRVADGEIVRNHQCISCMKCSSDEACPVQNTIGFTFGKGGADDAYKI